MQEVRAPLVSVTRSEADEKHTRIAYYVGDIMILDMEILKEYVPSVGPVDDMTLVQLLVTPHHHLTVLGDFISFAKAGKTFGPAWKALLKRAEELLSPPQR